MKKILSITTLLAAIFLYACTDDRTGANEGLTKLSIKMTDAPGAYDSVLLSVKEINVLTSEGQYSFPVGDKPFDILRFRMGKDTLLAGQDIPAGYIQEIRLVLNETGNRVVVDGKSFDLITPSGQQSGVKIKIGAEIVADAAYTILLDFDAARSIVKTGNGKYLLKPVIRGACKSVGAAVTDGVITGTITPVVASPKIYVINGTDTLGAVSDAEGKFYFSNVKEGTYEVNVVPTNANYRSRTIDDVVVSKGAVNDLGVIVLPMRDN